MGNNHRYTEQFQAWRESVVSALEQELGEKLLGHCLRVEQTAVDLARCWQVDESKAATAALLHDYGKPIPRDVLLQRGKEFGIVITDIEANNHALLHGPVGAELVRRRWDLTDKEVLRAIRYHTTGKPGMSGLEKVIYLADAIEPGRKYPGVEKLRRLAREDLDAACLATLEGALCYVIRKGWLVHPLSVQARNWFILNKMSSGDN